MKRTGFRRLTLEEARKKGLKRRFRLSGALRRLGTIQTPNGGNGIPEGSAKAQAKPRRGKKGFRSIRRDRTDHYFSLYVRYRDNWTCQRCGTRYGPITASLQCSHFYGRARENTRFDPINADAQCAGCHNFLGANPELHREWKLQQIGEAAYTLLRIRAEARCKKDRKLMSIICRQMYEKEKARFDLTFL